VESEEILVKLELLEQMASQVHQDRLALLVRLDQEVRQAPQEVLVCKAPQVHRDLRELLDNEVKVDLQVQQDLQVLWEGQESLEPLVKVDLLGLREKLDRLGRQDLLDHLAQEDSLVILETKAQRV
jgi:hypothetical protein